MKLIKPLFTIAIICILQVPAIAIAETSKETEPALTVQETDLNTTSVFPELILRPVGVLSSAVGAGFYIASLPFAAVANFLEPHDALDVTYDAFILTPFKLTFQRPIGDYSLPL
jgi:hypothetical protein